MTIAELTYALYFAIAFWLMSSSWVLLGLIARDADNRPYVYGLRLLAFLLVIAAIIDKNRSPSRWASLVRRQSARCGVQQGGGTKVADVIMVLAACAWLVMASARREEPPGRRLDRVVLLAATTSLPELFTGSNNTDTLPLGVGGGVTAD